MKLQKGVKLILITKDGIAYRTDKDIAGCDFRHVIAVRDAHPQQWTGRMWQDLPVWDPETSG